MSFSEYISPLIGRLILAWFFLGAALDYGNQWDATIQLSRAFPPRRCSWRWP
ncbi:MAG: hypothetical protein WDM81_17705 [Rhizomicrobium sp.]